MRDLVAQRLLESIERDREYRADLRSVVRRLTFGWAAERATLDECVRSLRIEIRVLVTRVRECIDHKRVPEVWIAREASEHSDRIAKRTDAGVATELGRLCSAAAFMGGQ